MTAFTERDRAKRAKLKARYNSIRPKSASGDVGTYSPIPNSPKPNPVQVHDNRDDEQLTSRSISASSSAVRDTSPPSHSNDADDTTMDAPMKSQAPSNSAARQRATQLAMTKKKLAASRKAASPMKSAYNYKPIAETQKAARPSPPIETQVNVPYTPPRVVSKRAEMAKKLAASRAATSSPQPMVRKPEPDVKNSAQVKGVAKNSVHVKSNAFAYKSQTFPDAGSVKSKSSSFEKPEIKNRFAANKAAATRSNELARLRAASPAVVAAAAVKPISKKQMGYSSSNELTVEHYESDEDESMLCDESTLCDEDLAKDAVLQRREQFRKKQEGKKTPNAISDPSIPQPNKQASGIVLDPPLPSIREQFLKKQEEKKRSKVDSGSSFLQPSNNMPDQFDYSFPNHLVSMSDSVSDPPLQSISHSSSRDIVSSNPSTEIQQINEILPPPPPPSISHTTSRDIVASNPSAEIQQINEILPPPPHKTESENVSQDFGDGFGFSQEEFSHASWGLGPAFSAEIIANGDADWSRPVNCSADQQGSKSAEWAASFDAKASKYEEEDVVKEEDKENIIKTSADAPQGDIEVSPSATASVQYVDFGVGKSRGGSVDCDSIIDEEEDVDNSIVSEETTASATEFDPLSMFGGSDLSQEMEELDDNAQSKVSWAIPTISKEEDIADNSSSDQVQSVSSSSQKMTRAEDDSNSISFPSLNSGGLTKPPKPAHQLPTNNSTKAPPPPPPAKNVMKPPPDSPSGTESLESWWQSRYASSQNNDINAAVQEALLNEASSVSKKSQADSSKNTSGVSTLSTSLTPVRSNEREPSCEMNEAESCSIFSGISGLDEDGLNDSRRYQAAVTKKLLGPTAQNIDLAETEEEDIFSGVSVSNTKDLTSDGQTIPLREASAFDDSRRSIKSDMGGNSSGFTLKRANAESHSMLYGNNTVGVSTYAQSKVMNSLADGMSTVSFSSPIMQPANAASQYMRESKESLSSLPESNYGVIELKKNEKSSPANSHTSDITSSVIFGCDPPRRVAHQRYGRDHERILETNESEEADSVISKEASATMKSEQIVEGEGNETTIANRGVSLVAPSSCDSTSQGSTFDQTKTTAIQTEGESQATSYYGLSGLRDQAKSAILSRFSCGLLDASSFAVCAPNGGQMQAESSLNGASSDSNKRSDSNNSDDTHSESPGDEFHDEFDDSNSRHSIELSSKKETSLAPPPFSPHSIRLRESSFGKGGVEVMPEDTAKATSSIGAQNELPVYKSASEAQKEAHEALLLYAYTALSVSPPKTFVEKGQGAETNPIIYPSIDGGVKEMGIMMERFRSGGIAVLKLNTHNQWQPRVLTVTKEVHVFNKTDDARYKGIDSCPKGLLWLKKFSDSEQSVASITGKKGKGGLFFSTIESVSVTKGIHPLSKKQQKGVFKDSYTFVLFSNDKGSKREIYFRVANKDDVVLLSAGFQAVIDRVKNDENLKSKGFKLTVDTLMSGGNAAAGQPHPLSPVLSPTKPLSVTRKAVANPISDHRWEV